MVDLPKEYSSINRSNVQLVSEDLLLFGSTGSAKAVFENMEGKVLYLLSRSGISYRTYWIPKEDLPD